MKTLFEKKYRLKIRNKYKANVKRDLIKSDVNLQACHILGLRELKYLEKYNILDIDFIEKIATSSQNCVLLNFEDHKLFELNKKIPDNLSHIQKLL